MYKKEDFEKQLKIYLDIIKYGVNSKFFDKIEECLKIMEFFEEYEKCEDLYTIITENNNLLF